MICMGSSKIWMAASSELGLVDSQIIRVEDGEKKVFSAHSLVKSYDKLFGGAVRTKDNLEPYVQQLAHFDVRDISKYRSFIDLSDDIAVKSLQTGMLKGASKKEVEEQIKVFLDPTAGTLAHGRPIYCAEAESCGLNVEEIDVKSRLWSSLYELYVRTDRFVSRDAVKAVESGKEAFQVSI